MSGRVIFPIILAVFLFLVSTLYAEPNLVAHWEFDEGNGITAGDSSGNGNDGTLVNGPVWTSGIIEGALDFDGSNDYVLVFDDDSLDVSGAITVSTWLKLDGDVSTQNIIKKIASDGSYTGGGYHLLFTDDTDYSDGTCRMVFQKASGTGGTGSGNYGTNTNWDRVVSETNTWRKGVWYHFVAAWDGTTDSNSMKMYINGVLDASHTAGQSTIKTNSYNLKISGSFEGKIDDLRIYNRALSDGEIEQIYREGLGGIAYIPNPYNWATSVDPNVVLSWSPGKDANSHDVYFGTDYNDVNGADVNSPEYKGNFDINSYDPCGLDLLTTYYWRVDEVNDANLWKGNVWSFETDGPTAIEFSETQFYFYADYGESNPDDQVLGISNSGIETLNWQINEDCNWLSVEPTSGSSTGEVDDVNFSVDISGLAVGVYNCNLTVSDPNAYNSPQIVQVTLCVLSDNTLLVPIEYSTIQAAIDAAIHGSGIIVVVPGVYKGSGNRDLDFHHKAITVQSVDPNDPCVVAATVIDCNGSYDEPHRGFYFHSLEDTCSIVDGFTITNGYGPPDYWDGFNYRFAGGAIFCYYSSPTIKNCIITENRTSYSPGSGDGVGGGICCGDSSPIISNCKITNNTSGHGNGGGIYGDNTNVSIIDCVIRGNYGGNGCAVFVDEGSPIIDGCIVRNNSSSGTERGSLYFDGYASPKIINCLIARNHAYPGGICAWYSGGNARIKNCTIVSNNQVAWGGAIYWEGSGTVTNCICRDNHFLYGGRREIRDNLTVNYTNIEDNNDPNDSNYIVGIGNIDADPCFVDANDFHLQEGSPCINAGDPNYTAGPGETDIDGQPRVMDMRIDMGADETGECMATTNPDYANWVYWGKPDCWCYARQCRGDTDGKKLGPFWVGGNDLTFLRYCIGKLEPPLPIGGECADFDHQKLGPFWVSGNDLTILRQYIGKLEAQVPPCANPPDELFNFWLTP